MLTVIMTGFATLVYLYFLNFKFYLINMFYLYNKFQKKG